MSRPSREPRAAATAGRPAVRRLAALVVGVLLATAELSGHVGAAPVAAPSPGGTAADEPVDYVVAVDQSGSLKEGEIDREREAVNAIAMGEPSNDSTMEVLGFASAEEKGQTAVDKVCPSRALDTVGREKIAECAARLRQRTEDEGAGTDFIEVVRQAVADLGARPGDTPRVLFLLTDGILDVEDSLKYKDLDAKSAEEAAEADLADVLADAADAQVQIWPLGFGDANETALRDMAAAGYQAGCTNIPGARPQARVVRGDDLDAELQSTFATARCLYHEKGEQGRPPGDLTVRISPLATEGTIVVSKGDPAVTASYHAPDGREIKPSDSDEDSTYTFSGQGRATESLRITRPLAGRWTVKLDAPEDHRERSASVNVLWHGSVRSTISLSAYSPAAGSEVDMYVPILTRQETRLEKRDLKGIKVAGSLTGQGIGQAVPIRLADDGKGADESAGDGRFSGTVSVPDTATGSLTFESRVSAVGLDPDVRSQPAAVSQPNQRLEAVLALGGARLHPGDTHEARLTVDNRDSRAHTLSLAFADTKGAGLRLTPQRVTVPAGTSGHDVMVRLSVGAAGQLSFPVTDEGSALGGKILVTDEQGTVLDGRLLDTVTVRSEPDALDRWGRPAALALALLALGGVVLAFLWLRRRAARRPRGTLVLEDTWGRELARHPVTPGREGWYRFDIVDTDSDSPRVQRSDVGTWGMRRNPDGGADLRMPDGNVEKNLAPGQGLRIGDDLVLKAVDEDDTPPPDPELWFPYAAEAHHPEL
ncbi:vWA domain-containing protein [Streptomyces sp. NPDC057798]|uniref:vWA domain-containing protein n=1 Tax=Streptomyces sp. NPDC057798 TaxID=3346252 RepID=UPI003692EE23